MIHYQCSFNPSFLNVSSCSVSLIGVEGGNATRISRFANYLRNLLPSSDPVVMEMASKAMGHLSMAGDTFTAEYVEFEVKRALEWLGADRNEGRRHAAVGEKYWIDPVSGVYLWMCTRGCTLSHCLLWSYYMDLKGKMHLINWHINI